MKPILFAIMLALYFPCRAQTILGANIGLGMATSSMKQIILTPRFECFAMKKISSHVAVGGGFGLQRYSFSRTINDMQSAGFFGILSYMQKSSYLLLTPRADIGLGKRQHIRIDLSAGPGIAMGGTQVVHYSSPTSHFGSIDVPANTTGNISPIIFVNSASITELLASGSGYYFYAFQEFSYIPSYVSKYGATTYFSDGQKLFLKTNYIAIGVAITYWYGDGYRKPQKIKKFAIDTCSKITDAG